MERLWDPQVPGADTAPKSGEGEARREAAGPHQSRGTSPGAGRRRQSQQVRRPGGLRGSRGSKPGPPGPRAEARRAQARPGCRACFRVGVFRTPWLASRALRASHCCYPKPWVLKARRKRWSFFHLRMEEVEGAITMLGSDLQRNQDFFFFDQLEILFFYFIFIFLY